MLDSHYDDFMRLSEFPLEPEKTDVTRTATVAERSGRETAIAIVLQEGLKAHVNAGSRLAERWRGAIALLLWADANGSAITLA
ncbi:MAG: hypothetical protein AAFX40_07105 [Cyanobacteria bacterium J06639_1]